MADYICIDGGTTNTRIRLVQKYKISDCIGLNLGVGTSSGDPDYFKNHIKDAIDTILDRNQIGIDSITRILASGMITSELGLCHLDHALAPAGIQELHNSMKEVLFPEISPIPFVFIRGIKLSGDAVDDTDIMRGEETELMGIVPGKSCTACTYILPGSHTKVIFTDEEGRITDFFTTLTGEMIASLSAYTILKKSVDLENTVLDEIYLQQGYRYCLEEGINKALFKVRIADTIFKQDASARYSFFLGAVLCGDITSILKRTSGKIVIGGKKQLKEALYLLLKQHSGLDLSCLTEDETDSSVAFGAIRIFEYEGR